jgi:hypothetical protein
VFYFDALRTAEEFPPLWTQRASIIPDHMSWAFGVFAAGLAAWAEVPPLVREDGPPPGTHAHVRWIIEDVFD